MRKKFLLIGLAMLSMAAVAQDNFLTVDAQLRTRGEHNHGAVRPIKDGEQSANFVNERARLGIDYQRGFLEVKVAAQHTGLWGQDGMNDTNGRATLSEAWGKLMFDDHFFAQIGRQQLAYDDERLLGAQDWDVSGYWHDALKLGYEDGHNKLHAILSMNQTAENNRGDYYGGPMPYKNMQALWYHYQSQRVPIEASLMFINVGQEAGAEGHGRTYYVQTMGTDINFKRIDWNFHAAFYYQMGKNFFGYDIDAFMASAKAEVDIYPLMKLSAGYDYLSGNRFSNKQGAFDALFGSYHNFYGAMDLIPGFLTLGLHDIYAGAALKVDELSVQLGYHYFMTAEKYRSYGRRLGHEIDLKASYRLLKDVTVMGGFSTMMGTETMDIVAGGSHKKFQDWAWLQLNINPRIFATKW